jgi:arsenite methyltransferase
MPRSVLPAEGASLATGLQFNDEVTRGLEALYLTADAARRREAVLDALQLRPGERVLDIGTGPGFVAVEMAAAVGPAGRIQAIDSSDPMLAMAKKRCADKPWVDFQKGSATELPVEDASFDVAVSVQVYEYVADIAAALAEMYRVLRPGGRAAIVSTDWGSVAWNGSDAGRMDRVLEAFAEHCVHTTLPRTLAPRLRQAGFTVREQRVIPQFNPAYEPDSYSYRIAPLIASFVAGRGRVTDDDARAWLEDLRRTGERGEYFFSLNQYLCLAVKGE